MVHTIVGANWGDEGKGKVTDLLAEKSDIVVRFQGGANAGHTIINEYGKFALHLLPSGVFHPHIVNIIGPGVALNIEALLKRTGKRYFPWRPHAQAAHQRPGAGDDALPCGF